jgi:hypothetical protein
MWGALPGAGLAGWRHQLTATTTPEGALAGHGVREGQAMIATLRHWLIRVPARLIRHAGALICASRRATSCSTRSSSASAPCPPRPDQAVPGPDLIRNHATRGDTRAVGLAAHRNPAEQDHCSRREDHSVANRGFGSDDCNEPRGGPTDRSRRRPEASQTWVRPDRRGGSPTSSPSASVIGHPGSVLRDRRKMARPLRSDELL